MPVRSSLRLPRYEQSIDAPPRLRQSPPIALLQPPSFWNTSLTHSHYQVEPQEKKKTPKGRAKKRITYTRRFVNVTMTGGKRKVRTHCMHPPTHPTATDNDADEPQPYLVNKCSIWSLTDEAKAGTWIVHSLADPSLHQRAARLFLSPGFTYDDDSRFLRAGTPIKLLSVHRNKCRWTDWCTSGVFIASLKQRLRLLTWFPLAMYTLPLLKMLSIYYSSSMMLKLCPSGECWTLPDVFSSFSATTVSSKGEEILRVGSRILQIMSCCHCLPLAQKE